MGILNSMFAKWKHPQQGGGCDPDIQVIANPSSTPPQPQTPQSSAAQRYTELEASLTRSPQALSTKSIDPPQNNGGFKKFGKRLFWTGILLGVPAGIIYVVNLPYPVIRQPVSKTVPILLLPSNMVIDANFKKGQATIEEARQLIESPTSAADLDRGELKLKDGKSALDAIPAWYVADWADYSRGYWGYWEFSPAGLQGARIKAGQLEAKVFQEKNAQISLTEAEKTVALAKVQLQQATSPVDKKLAVQNWQAAIDQLSQIPPQTLAGRKAQQLVNTSTRDLKALAGLTIGNEKVTYLLGGAEEFAKKAAEAGRNPPHSSDRWIEVAGMWEEAIQRLKNIPSEDVVGYAEAQKRLAEYRASLSEVKVRLKNEQESVQALDRANQKLTTLWASLPKDGKDLNRNQAIASFMAINNDLEKVQNGTTVYLKAQEVKLQVQQQLKLLQQAK
ncbi:hypothetical protein [Pseudanabaena yagii]|uniref:Chromosome segregation ATPase n=1 Tax=Pseudanabaena yagii GIHE-NHR1 TaxID=2722753 RepID=A0ABX1LS85_9CYAN|nr:hypothetical protein [Pseudanabaena yagii]NMF57930.1 hypothetical protein [Pseudanabaena yagii GIHE-NHR1]